MRMRCSFPHLDFATRLRPLAFLPQLGEVYTLVPTYIHLNLRSANTLARMNAPVKRSVRITITEVLVSAPVRVGKISSSIYV